MASLSMSFSLTLLLTALQLPLRSAQLSNPLADNKHISAAGNKFLERSSAPARKNWPPPNDELGGSLCPFNLQLKWMSEATSSVYATPLITDLYADGYKDIIVPSFVHHLEVFQGDNGAQAAGFPAFHEDKVHASPLLYDIDHDGIQDILLATYNGEIVFFQDSGKKLRVSLQVPALPIDKHWFEGLDQDFNSKKGKADVQEEPDELTVQKNVEGEKIHLDEFRRQFSEHASMLNNLGSKDAIKSLRDQVKGVNAKPGDPGKDEGHHHSEDDAEDARRRMLLEDIPAVEADPKGPPSEEAAEAVQSLRESWPEMQERLKSVAAAAKQHKAAGGLGTGGTGAGKGTASKIADMAAKLGSMASGTGGAEKNDDGTGETFHYFDDYLEHQALDYMDDGWQWDEFHALHHGDDSGNTIHIDPHIMCTPALGDLDSDGVIELVIPVTYLFDRAYYDSPEHRGELPEDIDLANYVASGVVVYDLVRRNVKWSTHLDLTTDHVSLRAYVYSSPTLVDLDHDGNLEILMGTSVGFIYALNHHGSPVPGWPVQMGEVQAQVAAADVDGDGWLEVFASDTRGSVAMFNRNGTLIWDVHLRATITQAPTFADVDGDGRLDAVLGSNAGEVYALDAQTGRMLTNFPFSTGGRILAPVTPVRLLEGSQSMQLLVPSFDGYIYTIDGISGCADTLDISDTSYSAILVDDLDRDGRLELLVSTMSGHLYCIGTPALDHPLKTWPQQIPGSSNFVARHAQIGVYARLLTRQPKDIRGATFPVEFKIVDVLDSPDALAAGQAVPLQNSSSPGVEFKKPNAPYSVKVLLTNIDTVSMNSGEQPVIGMQDVFHAPGRYVMHVPCPRSRATAIIRIEMRDANGILYVDEFQQSFHLHFDKLLKWLVAAPLLVMGLFLLVLQPQRDAALPT